jgi:hypothetical protein
MSGEISYKTHILIGVRPNRVMSVIAVWPHVPKQAEVQKKTEEARDGYVTFALCTPTSIMHVGEDGDGGTNDRSSGTRRRG